MTRAPTQNVPTDPCAMLRVALEAVDAAQEHLATRTPARSRDKADRDPVTDLDPAIECLVRDHLADAAPGIGFEGEEGGTHPATDSSLPGDARWVLDPIDGTANFWRGLPLYGVSLALLHQDRTLTGVIALPGLRRRYWAAEGYGAYRNGAPIHAAATHDLDQAIIAIGDYGAGPEVAPHTADCFALHQALAPTVRRIRMLGSAATDLALVADGTLDASLTVSNRTWDTAAGVLIAREAGAIVIDHDATPHTLASARTYAIAPRLKGPLLALLTAGATP